MNHTAVRSSAFRLATLLGVAALASALATAQPVRLENPPKSGDAPAWIVNTPDPAPGPLDNPLKGWCTYSNQGTQHSAYSSMAFWYVPWRTLEPVEGDYRFDQWEQSWDTDVGSGKHVILRVYLDYPSLPVGVPQWLIDAGVTMTPYTQFGGGLSPDYADERLVVALERLIAAMGARFNSHPRVAVIQAGLLGHWGEWHTWPTNELFAPEATQIRVLNAYRAAFPDKVIQLRYGEAPTGPDLWNGYHDDYFPEDTDCFLPSDPCTQLNWYFMPRLERAGKTQAWRTRMIGGEMVPGVAYRLLSDAPFTELTPVPPGTTNWQLTLAMLKRANFSWVGPYNPALESAQPDEFITPELFRQRSDEMVRTMGYEYRLTRVAHTAPRRGSPISVRIDAVNQGIAPFYYPWPVELALLDTSTQPATVAAKWTTTADIRDWLPGEFRLNATTGLVNVPAGRYALAIGIRDPWKDAPSITFANDLPVVDRWTVLATVNVP